MFKIIYKVPQQLINNKQIEISEILDSLKQLLSKHKLTEEEFAILYGYTYLAKQELMKIDDLRFILSNTLVRNQQM